MTSTSASFDLLFEDRADAAPFAPAAAAMLLERAESLLESGHADELPPEVWRRYLDHTSCSSFLKGLETRERRLRWSETTFKAIELGRYTLLEMHEDRVRAFPDRPLFQEMDEGEPTSWSYRAVLERTRSIAATLYRRQPEHPKLAILAANSLDAACCDLACLMFDIFVAPINVQFDPRALAWLFDRLGINLVVTDSQENYQKIELAGRTCRARLKVFSISDHAHSLGEAVIPLQAAETLLSSDEVESILARRPRRGLHDVATAMFTSGSTGLPKGVTFSMFNLVTKRFARAAALPEVGEKERLLCFLPLYHTFGRYLELLGMIYWGGTYVFAGNPSIDTLFELMPVVQPTGFISVPMRWAQIREEVFQQTSDAADPDDLERTFRKLVGPCLRWGLSAAGHLDPKVFTFFHRLGVALNSGFGMTEATGGVTMTPPGDYVEGSVGVPLPGVRHRMSDEGELIISGPYIARYLPEDADGAENLPPQDPATPYWLQTGDVFVRLDNAHLEIVDRLKDIYKNRQGQTIAPLKVESKFLGVPGIKRTFLVGDGRAYNVLLIAPDRSEGLLETAAGEGRGESGVWEYYRQLVEAANQDLAPYERVVNFTLLDRDFALDRNELTPKGTLKRKVIADHFERTIEELYTHRHVTLGLGRLEVVMPRWFFRDQRLLEGDIVVDGCTLHNRARGLKLEIVPHPDRDVVRIGDLEYRVTGGTIDLGAFARQPLLWVGNPSLIAFAPCRDAWDYRLKSVDGQPLLPERETEAFENWQLESPRGIWDERLLQVNVHLTRALFAPASEALFAIEAVSDMIGTLEPRIVKVVCQRLGCLAVHPVESVRCLAYQVLLLEEPAPDYGKSLPSFLFSNKSFLNEESLEIITARDPKHRQLGALRQRLLHYRTHLTLPTTPQVLRQLKHILEVLSRFVQSHPEYYSAVRAELAAWIVHKISSELSAEAMRHYRALEVWFDKHLQEDQEWLDVEKWRGKVVFDDRVDSSEEKRLNEVLVGTTLLRESILLANQEQDLRLREIAPGGIWIARLSSRYSDLRYHLSVNTTYGKHFDLLLILRNDMRREEVRATNFWRLALAGHPKGQPVLAQVGSLREGLGAMTVSYVSDLSVREKIRSFASGRAAGAPPPNRKTWRKLYLQAMGTFIQGWLYSGRQIVPGIVSPHNAVVPALDFRAGEAISSLSGWALYQNTLFLFGPMLRNFYQQVVAQYPWSQPYIDPRWIYDAFVETMGVADAEQFLRQLVEDLRDAEAKLPATDGQPRGTTPDVENRSACAPRPRSTSTIRSRTDAVVQDIESYIAGLKETFYVPLPLQNAIDRYLEWQEAAPEVTREAKEDIILQLHQLYQLERHPEIARYYLYRHTYFAKAPAQVAGAFDQLLKAKFKRPDLPATRLLELSELQSALKSQDDRHVFSMFVFPRARRHHEVEVMQLPDWKRDEVAVRTRIADRFGARYTIREALGPDEVGQLYRLFVSENFPKSMAANDRFIVVLDATERIVGGVVYKLLGADLVHLDGLVVSPTLQARGIGTELLEDFCARKATRGIRVVKTHFFLREWCSKRGFRVNPRWGGLVRFLNPVHTASHSSPR